MKYFLKVQYIILNEVIKKKTEKKSYQYYKEYHYFQIQYSN